VQLLLRQPRQGEHVVCSAPGCRIALQFEVQGAGVDAGATASALLKINRYLLYACSHRLLCITLI